MALTFRKQIEATAWELCNGEGTVPELRKRFDADPETPNFDPTKALEMLHILQLINYKRVASAANGKHARCHYLKNPNTDCSTSKSRNRHPRTSWNGRPASNGPRTSASSQTGSTRTVTRLKARKHERIRHHPIPL